MKTASFFDMKPRTIPPTPKVIGEKHLDEAFDNHPNRSDDQIFFNPEIKVKRETDTLYISKLKRSRLGFLIATVEVHDGDKGDKAPMPIGMLSERAMLAIYLRLTA